MTNPISATTGTHTTLSYDTAQRQRLDTVLRQLPEAGNTLYKNGTVILYTDETGDQMTTVPNLIGLTATEANKAAASAGINIEFSGNTTAGEIKSYDQSVAAGSSIAIGQTVTVYFRDNNTADLATE